ncbi:hypothetical protein IP81_07445 [Novosphingobium sp. AAP83]|uniref:type I-C CRISPR-associated protein Cas8c/Csd1 n=1 Tax=Novosphingobium sp. AAP83 TaxID=1523425 RepID=UPI0006B8CCB9|nr:type I-C CRISPR-associated protein Cas8c/Csd1 [Novosphingobium sp. AAP83]KPF91892.1 hypothetical protein IP81_07445 [Novosphingobium sp. AAP83]
MTILQALNSYYDRMAGRGEAEPPGYSREKISYAILLTPEGAVADVQDVRVPNEKGKFVPSLMNVPAAKKRASGIAPNKLWDKTAYVLGVTAGEDKRTAREHEAFKTAHEVLLANAEDAGLLALRRFLEGWTPEQFDENPHFTDEMKDANVVFRLDGVREYIHDYDRPAARALVTSVPHGEADDLCLVTGERGTAARLHPSIKGVRGAQSSGASLVSFNLDAFTSYGKEQGANAPVSEEATARYGAALNRMLDKGSRNRIQVGDTTTVFWADARGANAEAADAADAFAAMFLEPPTDKEEATNLKAQLEAVAKGLPASTLNPKLNPGTRFYILGLAPNAARLSVRFWYDGTFGDLERLIREHWRDMAIVPPPKVWPPSAWHLLIETAAQHKGENIPPLLGGELMRAILNGTRYPRSLMSAILIRIRAEQGDVSSMRAAILRGILTREARLSSDNPKEVPVALDEQDTNPAYRLGRWFAELEAIQQHALPGLNATIRDQFYSSASSAPARTFPVLIRNAMNHLAGLRKDGKAGGHEKRLEAIIAGVEHGLPRSLRIEDQARFAIGYYHQRASRFAKSPDTNEIAQGEETT